jgi:hypothetical protein
MLLLHAAIGISFRYPLQQAMHKGEETIFQGTWKISMPRIRNRNIEKEEERG